jgi:hypothetical protein
VADQGVGTYQLLILPLGEPTSAVSPLVQPGGERVVLGDELRSAPIVLVNVEEDGTPSRRLIDFIRKYQIDPETRRLGALRNEASSAEP